MTTKISNWLSSNIVAIVLLIASSTGAFVLGQTKGDAAQDAKIEVLQNQIRDAKENADGKVSRGEFAQFTKSVETQLQMINENLMALRREQRGR